jgi:hypothetical protein
LPPGWKIEGQIEAGENGTQHYQAYLKTPQVRFSAVKKLYQRAHIEPAKNVAALKNYVHKEETRVMEVASRSSSIPTLFDYNHVIAKKWDWDQFSDLRQRRYDAWFEEPKGKFDEGEVVLEYVDALVAQDIMAGLNGVEFIAVNPMFRNAWKKFYRAMVIREEEAQTAAALEESVDSQTDRQTDEDEKEDLPADEDAF